MEFAQAGSFELGLAFVAATLPFVIAIAVALRRANRPRGVADFFLYQQELSVRDFQTSSVGYGLQVAAIFLFFYWGSIYGFWALLIPLFWFLGYVLIAHFIARGRLDRLLLFNSDKDAGTAISMVIRSSDPGIPKAILQIIIAALVILALGVTAITELDYSTTLLIPVFLSEPRSETAPILLHASLLLFACFYVLWGGYRAVVQTDRAQVPTSVVTFATIAVALLVLLPLQTPSPALPLAAGLLAVSLAGVCYGRYRISRITDAKSIDVTMVIAAILCAASLLIGFISGIGKFGEVSWVLPSQPDDGSMFGFGHLGLLSLFLANGLWQFVDLSNLQRLQSVSISLSESDDPTAHDRVSDESRRQIAIGLRSCGCESSSLWLIACLMGIMLSTAGMSTDDLSSAFAQLGPLGTWVLLPAMCFVIVSFALSTIDGFISAMAFVFYHDINKPARRALLKSGSDTATSSGQSLSQQLLPARLSTIVAVVAVYLLYLVLKAWYLKRSPGVNPIGQILYAIYALQLSLFPMLWCAIVRRSSRPWLGLASIIAGLSAAFFAALSPTPPKLLTSWLPFEYEIPLDSWYVIPPLFALVAALLVFLPGYVLFRPKSKERG